MATETCGTRLAAAERAVQVAKASAEYHGWSGASGNRYTSAKAELRAAKREGWRQRAIRALPAINIGAALVALLVTLAVFALTHIAF